MNKQEILRKHLGQTPAQFQDLGKKNTLDAMEEYAELYHKSKVKTLGLFSVIERAFWQGRKCVKHQDFEDWITDDIKSMLL